MTLLFFHVCPPYFLNKAPFERGQSLFVSLEEAAQSFFQLLKK